MSTYLIYLFEISVCLALLLLFYQIFLSKLTFYQIRRFFLTFSVLFSFLIPALDIKVSSTTTPIPAINYQLIQPEKSAEQSETSIQKEQVTASQELESSGADLNLGLSEVVLSVYLIGVIFLIVKLLLTIIMLARKVKKSHATYFDGITVYRHSTEVPACSFFKYIFINPKLFNSEKETIAAIDHELVHVKERHSLDLLFFEVTKIILWFNPLVYIMKKEIERIHEFLADQKCSEKTGKDFYSHMLLKHAGFDKVPGLVHSFALLPLKFRIEELFKAQSPKMSAIRLVFLIPLISGLFFTFSCSDEFFGDNVFPNGKRLKSVKVVYHDEYGDMPQYDGQYYSWARFDRSGEITELKKGTFHEKKGGEFTVVFNNQEHLLTPDDNITWYLDYHTYDHLITLLFPDPNAFAKAKVESTIRWSKFDNDVDLNIIKNEEGLPVEISTTIHEKPGGDWSFFKLDNKEIFFYDSEGRLVKWAYTSHATQVDGHKTDHSYSRAVEYNSFGKVSRITADDLVYNLSYDEKGNVSEVNMGDIKYTYQYDEHGIRTKSFAYNKNGELEYSLDYEYEFF